MGTLSASWSRHEQTQVHRSITEQRLAVGGGWRSAVGGWRSAADGPWGLFLRAVLSKNKLGALKDSPDQRGTHPVGGGHHPVPGIAVAITPAQSMGRGRVGERAAGLGGPTGRGARLRERSGAFGVGGLHMLPLQSVRDVTRDIVVVKIVVCLRRDGGAGVGGVEGVVGDCAARAFFDGGPQMQMVAFVPGAGQMASALRNVCAPSAQLSCQICGLEA